MSGALKAARYSSAVATAASGRAGESPGDRAYEVEEIATVARTRLPPWTREVFSSVRAHMPWMDTEAGPVELLIGLDNTQWLPIHLEDSRDQDVNMRLIKSAFGHQFMIMGGWGTAFYPRDESMRFLKWHGRSGWRNTRVECEARALEAGGGQLLGGHHPRGRERAPRMGRGEPEDPGRAGGDTLPRLECHIAIPVSRATRTTRTLVGQRWSCQASAVARAAAS